MPRSKSKNALKTLSSQERRKIFSPGKGHFGTFHEGGVKYVILNLGLFKALKERKLL
jgi:hypothetical protein